MSRQGALEDERGFTLLEVIVTIVLMGIVLGIASSTWFAVIESRRVDSATNQVVADLRLAHTQATNRLTNSSFVVPADPVPAGFEDHPLSTYQVGPPGDLETRILPGDDQGTPQTQILVATTIVFKSDGSAEIDPAGDITVTTTDGDPDDSFHTINVNPVTSRIQIDP
jgi:prepilin-type N-terminal cleavage/methylation domain-containing protein